MGSTQPSDSTRPKRPSLGLGITRRVGRPASLMRRRVRPSGKGRSEMARTVEDVLSRRTRCLLFNAAASVEAAPRVAEILAKELGRDAAWQAAQVRAYEETAAVYRL